MKPRIMAFLLTAVATLWPSPAGTAQSSAAPEALDSAPSNSLFLQSARSTLEREFAIPGVSFLLLDTRTGDVAASRWDNPEKPIPLGSLMKPFTALAYAEAHGPRYPLYMCRGKASGCWQSRPHGELDVSSAIAFSCNSYFLALTAGMTSQQMMPIANRFGLEAPNAELAGPDLMGLGGRWRISPLHMARAYLELYRRRDEPGVREILAGMGLSARVGTGAAVDRASKRVSAMVKTGTALCTHSNHSLTDGFAIALPSVGEPPFLLLVRVHGVAGATAAVTAGRMLSRLEE